MKNIKLIRNFSILTKVAYYFPEIFFIIKNIKNTLKKKGIEIMPSPVKMDPRIKALWVANLLTGTYTKTTNFLRKDNCYCVLGVLCELHSKETGTPWSEVLDHDEQNVFRYESSASIPQSKVIEWSGFDPNNVKIKYKNMSYNIMFLNDSRGLSFSQLADLIEAQL